MGSAGNLPTPDPMAPFRVVDEWLADRGWTQKDRITWRSEHRGRVTLTTHEMAVRIQRRRDRAADYPVTVCAACLQASCWHGEFMCDRAPSANLTVKMASELRKLGREHPDHFSPDKIKLVHGRFPAARRPQ